MDYLVKTLVEMLRKKADELETGTSTLSPSEAFDAIEQMSKLSPEYRMSKADACSYLNMSRSTFDSWIRCGMIPKGKKIRGWKELYWEKADLDKFIYDQKAISKAGTMES